MYACKYACILVKSQFLCKVFKNGDFCAKMSQKSGFLSKKFSLLSLYHILCTKCEDFLCKKFAKSQFNYNFLIQYIQHHSEVHV